MPSDSRYKTILLFGGPGSGKGTQGQALGALPQFVHVSSGDIFRGLSSESNIGQEFRSFSSKGLLVPDELTVRVWLRYMSGMEHLEKFVPDYHILISDGIPRTSTQADMLAEHIDVLRILYFEMDEARLIARLKGRALKENRADDAKEDVIRKRIQVYEESTKPVLEKYPADIVTRLNADQSVLAVARDVFASLAEVVSN
ncbi:MAG: nucleoside monophosphate kinase [Planctomycetota bacterium]|nr:nucleoside monophosphate kinase [Planctomycetota bacterium]